MKLRLALFATALVLLAAPSAFACPDCIDGVCRFMQPEGYHICWNDPIEGCVGEGFCGLASTPLASQWKVAMVRVLPDAKQLPAATAAHPAVASARLETPAAPAPQPVRR